MPHWRAGDATVAQTMAYGSWGTGQPAHCRRQVTSMSSVMVRGDHQPASSSARLRKAQITPDTISRP
jgi:hypothetical protein